MACNDEHMNDREDSSRKQFKREDLLQYSEIFASEFNKSALHDRILVLKIMEKDDGVILPENYLQYEVIGTEDNPVASEEGNDEEEYIQGDGGANGSIEKQDKEIHFSRLDNQNSEHPINIAKIEIVENAEIEANKAILSGLVNKMTRPSHVTKTENTQTAEEVEKHECGSLTNEIPSQEQRLFIHSSWLAAQSPYFRALFYSSGMKIFFERNHFESN